MGIPLLFTSEEINFVGYNFFIVFQVLYFEVAPDDFELKSNNSLQNWRYAAKDYCSGEHGGTHLDAPYHFNKEGWRVADIPIERLIAKGMYENVNYKFVFTFQIFVLENVDDC